MEKEKRGANFTKNEIDLLIDIVLKYKHIVENKKKPMLHEKTKMKLGKKFLTSLMQLQEIFFAPQKQFVQNMIL